MRKLPRIINKEEYNLLLKECLKSKSIPKSKLRRYWIAMILAGEAGLRISEIIGLHALKSRCCKVYISEKRDGKKKIKFCMQCEKVLTQKDWYRDKDDWQIKPLVKSSISNGAIRVENAKGQKDRVVGLPGRFTEQYIKMLPLKINRRAFQSFVTNLAKKVLDKHVTIHTLRHVFATEFFNKTGGDIRTLQHLLGHSSINTTSIYAHIDPQDAIRKQKEVFG